MVKRALITALVTAGLAGLAGWILRVQVLDALCGTTPPAPTAELEDAIRQHAMLLDVRMYVETRKPGAELIPQAVNVPLLRLRGHLNELPRDRQIITFCVSGKRAGRAADMLRARGFKALSGGGIANLRRILIEEGASKDTAPADRPAAGTKGHGA
jgi:rhodanese-related sulfurtransferase